MNFLMGRRQAVSHWILIPVFPGSNPGAPKFRLPAKLVVCWWLLVLSLSACTPSGVPGPAIQLAVQDVSVSASRSLFKLADSLNPLRAETSGQNTTAELTSLKYFIRQIGICETMTVTNTTYTDSPRCLVLYTKVDNAAYQFNVGTDYAAIAGTARQDVNNFVDLRTASGKAQLSNNITLKRTDVGIYNWGYVNYYPAVRFKGSLKVNNGATTSTYLTHDGVTSYMGSGNHVTESTANFTTGISEEATVLLASGGTWFRLHSPLAIDHADIDAFTQYSIDLLFNTEGMVKAHSNAVTLAGTYLLRDSSVIASSNKMSIAPLEFCPVPRISGQTITKEAYTFDFSAVAGVSDRFNLRFQLFYVTEDETKAITGTEGKVLYRIVNQDAAPMTTTEILDFPRISVITRNADGTLNFLLPDGTAIIQNFTRLTTAGATGTASVLCSSNWAPSNCSGTLTVPITLSTLSTI